MIEEVAPSLFRVEVPIPNNPLQSINSYFIKAPDRTLIIDTGMNLPESKKAISEGLREIRFILIHL